jgi:hypothetical protein
VWHNANDVGYTYVRDMKREDYGPVKLKIAKCKDNHLPKTQTRANAGTVFSGGVSSGASASTTIVSPPLFSRKEEREMERV